MDLDFDLDLDGDDGDSSEASQPSEDRESDGARRTTGVPTADGEADGDGWQLVSPTVPVDGTEPVTGCTICAAGSSTKKCAAPGLVFRRIDGVVFAAMCWGCIKTGTRNAYQLPIPPQEHQSITHWRCFEHEMPEHKRARKPKRERIVGEAIAATRSRLEARADDRKRAEERAAADALANEDPCEGCGMPPCKPGLLYGQLADGTWVVGLCQTCGGSIMHREPPKFSGPPLTPATGDGWMTRKDSACPTGDPDAAFRWSQQAITATRNRLKLGEAITVVQGAPTAAPDPEVTATPKPKPTQEPEPQESPAEADEFDLDEPPDTGLDAPPSEGDDEFDLDDDDVPL